MWSRQVAPLTGYALRDDIASITDYRKQDQLTDKEKVAIAFMRKVAPFSGFLLTADIESTQSADKHAFGTGFFVSSEGHILTNNHVVAECKRLATREGKPLRLISRNVRSDLALLKADTASAAVAVFLTGPAPKMGDAVVAYGFPLPDLLSSEGNVATGILSATSGLQDDVRFVQISAPVQPGNSGGPLLDQSGHVIGVVVAKLDALRVARAIGDIPQNVNFAVQWSEVRAFLDEERVPYRKATSLRGISTPDVAALARRMSVAIDCTE
jgi:S1-C subfamily serine protease